MEKDKLEKALNEILDNTKTIPAIRENLAEIKSSLRASHKRLNGLCDRVDKIQAQNAKLTERMSIQETICGTFRENKTALSPIKTAEIKGSYQLRTQWVILLAAILVALITLLGQWFGSVF